MSKALDMVPSIFRALHKPVLMHAAGIKTRALVWPDGLSGMPCGVSCYPPGVEAPPHRHDSAEQILVLQGQAELSIGSSKWRLQRHDSCWIPADIDHAYRNVGNSVLKILWVYETPHVTRSFGDGQAVPLLAQANACE